MTDRDVKLGSAAAADTMLLERADAGADPLAEGIPAGFDLRPDGIYWRTERPNGNEEWAFLCSPLRVVALPRDSANKGWGRLVELTTPDGITHRVAIPATLFADDGAELRRLLLDLGVDLAPDRRSREAFSRLLLQWRPSRRALTTDRLGWSDATCTTFVLGDGRVLGSGGVVYQHESAPAAAKEMRSAGSLEDWKKNVAAPCAGNPLLLLSVSLAFAGPLLELLGLDGGGIHLRGASSSGKSTAQRVATSVWGSDRFMHTWRATANGLEGVATASNSSLLVLDEIGEVHGREAGQAAYMLTNGQGKTRAGRTGIARPPATWRVMILSSGEIGLVDKMAEIGQRAAAGQQVRLLDIAADGRAHGVFDDLHGARTAAQFADRLKQASACCFGTAGPEFVQHLIDEREEVVEFVRRQIDRFRQAATLSVKGPPDGQVERAITRLAVIAAAGEAATEAWLTGWPRDAAHEAALTAFRIWLDGRGGNGAAEEREAIERTRAFLLAHEATRFQVLGGEPDARIRDRAGWRDESCFYISTDAWKEIHKGSDPARAARLLHAASFLEKGDGQNLMTRLAESQAAGRPRVYKLLRGIVGATREE